MATSPSKVHQKMIYGTGAWILPPAAIESITSGLDAVRHLIS